LVSLPNISQWNTIKYGRHLFDGCISLQFSVNPKISKYYKIFRK